MLLNKTLNSTFKAVPWTIKKKNPMTNEYMKNPDGTFVWEGYCIELIEKLANMMEFDYDLVIPEDGDFGVRVNGIWNGLVGDLAKGVNILYIILV
jgi:ionotropic glutamate receptor